MGRSIEGPGGLIPSIAVSHKYKKFKLSELQLLADDSSKINAPHFNLLSCPSEFYYCHYLKCLNLSHNALNSFDPPEGSLFHLEHLDLSFNNLRDIPASISRLTKLLSIDLAHNCLTRVEFSFSTCIQLKRLNLAHNCIYEICDELFCLKNLREFCIANNCIQFLPLCVGRAKLEYLDIAYNCIQVLPDELSFMAELQTLIVRGNPLRYPPLSMFERGHLAAIHFLRLNMLKKVSDVTFHATAHSLFDVRQPELGLLFETLRTQIPAYRSLEAHDPGLLRDILEGRALVQLSNAIKPGCVTIHGTVSAKSNHEAFLDACLKTGVPDTCFYDPARLLVASDAIELYRLAHCVHAFTTTASKTTLHDYVLTLFCLLTFFTVLLCLWYLNSSFLL